MARIGICLVIVALIGGMAGCAGPVQYSLTISTTEGGEITTPDEGTSSYDEGTEVPLVALPHTGYRFVNWSGDVSAVEDINAASTTVSVNGDYSITANFVKQYNLTISSTTGGSVTLPGEGTYARDEGEVVDLVAQPEQGYHFVSWTGDVSSIGDPDDATTSVTMNSSHVITANFAVDPYFWTDTCVVLNGPSTLPTEERNPCVALGTTTNMVVDSVRVDLPDGRSITLPSWTDVFDPEAEGTPVLRFYTCEPAMPTAGGEYIFTGLDVAGEPIPGARDTDIWVGVEPPDPPANVRAEVVEDGILVSWDESPIIPGSFEPAAGARLGGYQLVVSTIETRGSVYGAGMATSSHIIPRNKADFIEGRDSGLSLSEMEDGMYRIDVYVLSVPPEGSLGTGLEHTSSDPGQAIVFTIGDGEITIE